MCQRDHVCCRTIAPHGPRCETEGGPFWDFPRPCPLNHVSRRQQQWSIKDQLVGTWTLASWEHALPNGSKDQSYGTNPKGIVVFDAKGRFFLMFARPDLPKIASNAPATATSEEAKDLLSGSIAYFGTYGVNDADKVINLRLEASTFPNQLASDQNGTITSLTADELHYEMTALAGGKISIVLRREALGCGRARDWNAVVPRAFSPHEL
jgi:Lipocalin-like domain